MTRVLSNGYTYEVIQNFLGGYNLYYKSNRTTEFKKSTTSFDSLAQAEEWFEKQESDYLAWRSAPKVNHDIPAGGYYSITGYFGD